MRFFKILTIPVYHKLRHNGGARVVGEDCDEDDNEEEEEEDEEVFIGDVGGGGEGGCRSAATICMGFYGDGGIHDRLVITYDDATTNNVLNKKCPV